LRELHQRRPTEMVIACGMHGSPIDRIDNVLADLFGTGNYLKFDALEHEYKSVLALDIGTVRAQPAELAKQIIVRAQQRAIDEHALLILHRLQLLALQETVGDRLILAQISTPDPHAVLGIYEYVDEDAPQPYEVFPNFDIRPVVFDRYTSEHTLNS